MKARYPVITSLAFLSLLPGGLFAQNALDFDGVNDKVTVPAASGQIVGGTGISLACWVYPRNAAPAYPDFDGFAGMRNDNNADFYLLQVSPSNTVEGRFRNSAGQDYTMEYSGLQLNTWQFLVLTYNGSQLTIYADGVNVATAPASGSITNSAVDLLIGDVLYDINDFYLNGRVDEVSLWNRGLSQAEVNCIYANGVDVTDTGVKLYYKMDEGLGGENNAPINNLTPSKGLIPGNLSGFALTGNTSNFVPATDVGNNMAASICPGETYLFNGQQLSASGVYGAAYDIGEACDSLVTLTLTVKTVNIQVDAIDAALISAAANGSWQWLDCNDNYAAIPGATQQGYTSATGGYFAVEVTENGCVDTSACYLADGLGIRATAAVKASISPVPATDLVHLDFGRTVQGVTVTICDINGRELQREILQQGSTMDLSIADLAPGPYLVQMRSAVGSGVQRLMKQ